MTLQLQVVARCMSRRCGFKKSYGPGDVPAGEHPCCEKCFMPMIVERAELKKAPRRPWAYVIASVETSEGRWQLRLLRNGVSRGFLSTTGPCNLEAAEAFTSKKAADEASRTRVRVKESSRGPEYYLERVRKKTITSRTR